jgi:hypothetical protein
MVVMSDSPGAVPWAFSRRTLLAAALVGTTATAAGCTTATGEPADAVTPAQVDQLAEQVAVQTALVDAYDRAFAAAPGLAGAAASLAEQARAQLDRLRDASPGAGAGSAASGSAASGSVAGSGPAPAVPADPDGARAFLRAEVGRAWAAHAAACPDFTGARAALLGSIAAGLRGAEGQLA